MHDHAARLRSIEITASLIDRSPTP